MKIILDIKENKADFILDWLKQYTFVKIKPVKRPKEKLVKDIEEALEEVKLIESGKKEGKLLKDFLDEL
jgi:hypothetical protein